MDKSAYNSILFVTHRPDIIMEKGKGPYLWDTTGKKYLDFIGGWAVTSLGHSPDALARAICHQASTLINASPAFYNKPMLELAELLTSITCFDRVFFGSSGAEANESAIKLARKFGATKKNNAYEIITTVNSFHGRTLATMSASGKPYWKDLFEPKVPGFIHVPFNDNAAIENAVSDKTCAIMIEPIQGEAGVFPANQNYINFLRQICNEKEILLIFDEVQTGIGRTGKMFAYEDYHVEPDIMTLAKGLGGGFPVSAMLTKEKYNIFEAGDQGGTYTGQPLAMAAALAVVREMLDNDILARVQEQEQAIIQGLESLAKQFPIRNIRGRGLLLAFDIEGVDAAAITAKALDLGLIINAPQKNSIRLMPPLVITSTEVEQLLDILSCILKEMGENE